MKMWLVLLVLFTPHLCRARKAMRRSSNSEKFSPPNGNGANLRAHDSTGRARLQSGQKSRAEGATALPKASLSRLCCCLFFFNPTQKRHRTTNPILDTTTLSQ